MAAWTSKYNNTLYSVLYVQRTIERTADHTCAHKIFYGACVHFHISLVLALIRDVIPSLSVCYVYHKRRHISKRIIDGTKLLESTRVLYQTLRSFVLLMNTAITIIKTIYFWLDYSFSTTSNYATFINEIACLEHV